MTSRVRTVMNFAEIELDGAELVQVIAVATVTLLSPACKPLTDTNMDLHCDTVPYPPPVPFTVLVASPPAT